MNPVKQVLTDARQLLIDRDWCQGFFFRNAAGNKCFSSSPDCVSYCSIGAIMGATQDHRLRNQAREALAVALDLDVDDVAEWNDVKGRTKDEALAAFQAAIEAQP